ncbi:hypothetical protein VPNG_04502 [Cytospora leucostoma]|uniref:FHA domain-containing protein n=1 Tax=Cytospora leucostoma TaxID=1230097 RepID=A0A423XCF9_9PEZI|nr:hypothetical protein VPNG_04502 [Cytospora leucostoma]
MTAVASPPSFSNINRPAWGINGGQSLDSMNSEDVRGALMPRKTISRTNSSTSVSSNSSTTSNSTAVSSNGQLNTVPQPAAGDLGVWPNAAPRKRPQGKGPWNGGGTELGRMPTARPQMTNGLNGASQMSPAPLLQSAGQMAPQRQLGEPGSGGQPVLYLLPLNGTFERKTIQVPFYPETLRVGRQTNNKTVPTPMNGFFDSKVLSRQHAEIWADRQGKIWIRDVKSSNGTFVNGSRLSPENRESEPHELQSGDHLELGIDIVSEDQKSVVHHKVAAKVEHAGFPNPSNNLLDMNFGDLDPANGSMMMPQAGMPFRGRTNSQASTGTNGRMAPSQMMNAQSSAMPYNNRGLMNATFSAELIVKKLRNEMRNARQQAQDLSRTSKFLDALVSNEDIKTQDKPEVPEPPKPVANGQPLSFRSDAKTRFSDPPAPPPQQPLPEKPDVARDPSSLKRSTTERPRIGSSNTSPVRHDNLNQIIQLTEALNSAKREIDGQTAKMRDLEEMLQKEREAREAAEQLAKRLEDDAQSRANGSAKSFVDDPTLEEAFEPPAEASGGDTQSSSDEGVAVQPEVKEDRTKYLQSQIDNMLSEMRELKEQVDLYKKQAEQATAERDADRKTLAEMVLQIRQRDEEAAALKAAAQARARSVSSGRERGSTVTAREPSRGRSASSRGKQPRSSLDGIQEDALDDKPTLSRANTITPTPRSPSKRGVSDQAIRESIPYASMFGVVLIGMGLMAYLNGWQPQPRLEG